MFCSSRSKGGLEIAIFEGAGVSVPDFRILSFGPQAISGMNDMQTIIAGYILRLVIFVNIRINIRGVILFLVVERLLFLGGFGLLFVRV